eukprot:Gregarina_sp_Pseudo_9__2655@NODE_2907_length_829_cov_44_858228_g2656_i0_p1_GENE_NODE_2907_length_829_cov_44_858228_g2656_i0NODE_2907_length_829_cov_44_858228_g2656_i0_p1_ORF_typecomplete_len238_score42_92DeoC/PF01791_9/3_8e45ArgoMid/PF16487_5/0_29ArgoMid/PF16487_5/8_4e03ArgoMid/PF16487_5/1_5e02CoA_binding_2/PF13380_6/6_3e03CoA_binding_2/PF13380_6/11CoA_binding_2/PF13380_6/5_6MIT_C/PF16565_5/0_026_NODE_2907_length_829_cov_44_858228_g2656_i086799
MESLVARCLDVTTLDDATDTIPKVEQLCKEARNVKGEEAAAVCIFPRFVPYARKVVQGSNVAVATVVNFPHGADDIEICEAEINASIAYGAQEIDFVFPYKRWKQEDAESKQHVETFVKRIMQRCKDAGMKTKVILETGILSEEHLLRSAIRLCIESGVDFLKTSTGKVEIGARPQEVKIMVGEIVKANRPVGLKVSGGVRTLADASQYIEIAKAGGMKITGPDQFRVGASKLHQAL